MKADVIVLGAGIIGVSIALNLQQRNRAVVLIDKDGPGRGTSYGNAGVIQREAILPYSFPQNLMTIFAYVLNNRRDMHYHPVALKHLAPTLFRYWLNGRPEAVRRTVTANLPLFEQCLLEHDRIARAAGVESMLRRQGWITTFRNNKTRDTALSELEKAAKLGVKISVLSKNDLITLEPHLGAVVIGGLHYLQPYSVADPLALTEAYFGLFEKQGGKFLIGDARTLQQSRHGSWHALAGEMLVTAKDAVVALGPWSNDVFRPLGYEVPFFVKRGYHQHFRPKNGAVLNHPVLDADGGYVIAPMRQGIRVTTGVEFALRDTKSTPVQMHRIEPWLREFFPVEDAIESQPWMGSRPCLPDLIPVISKAPAHKSLYFAFGHAHQGLTLAGSTGRLMAELMTDETPFTDPYPYRMDRF
jgi:D-amino-acid dehydrogenase